MDKITYSHQKDYLRSLRIDNDQFLLSLENYAAENRIPILFKESIEFLEFLITITKPKSILEIGTAIGYSTIRIAKKIPYGSFIYTIEKSENNIRIAEDNFSKSNQNHKIILLKGEAEEIISKRQEEFDFIFLDADKKDYSSLLILIIKKLRKGGILFVDNLLWHGFTASKRAVANNSGVSAV